MITRISSRLGLETCCTNSLWSGAVHKPKQRHSELKVRALTAPQDFPKSHLLGLLELQRNVVTAISDEQCPAELVHF